MKKLLNSLNFFQIAQIDKFVERMPKHPKETVTDDKYFYDFLQPSNQIFLEQHLISEFCEYFNLSFIEYENVLKLINFTKKRDKQECVDIANLAFLIWCL